MEIADDTVDLRVGPPISDALLALVPLVGVWDGVGLGVVPAEQRQFRYVQFVRFAHDGRPFLIYESRSWLIDDEGGLIRSAWRESGFWRPGAAPDDLEVVLASNTGQTLQFTGVAGERAESPTWELETGSATPTPTATTVAGERRIYALTDGDLSYATELAIVDGTFEPHLNATLVRRTSPVSAT